MSHVGMITQNDTQSQEARDAAVSNDERTPTSELANIGPPTVNPCAHCKDSNLQCTYNRQSRRRGRVATGSKRAQAGTESEIRSRNSMVEGPRQDGFTATSPNSLQMSKIQYLSSLENGTLESAIHPAFDSLSLNPGDAGIDSVESMQDWWNMPEFNFGFGASNFNYASNSMRGNTPHGMESVLSNGNGEGARSGDHIPRSQQIESTTADDIPPSNRSNSEGASSQSSRSSVQNSLQAMGQPSQPQLKYPVLIPLLPHLGSIVSSSVACDLLEAYFATSAGNIFQPSSPYLISHVFRKDAFLRSKSYRRCRPVLLASILWVAAQAGERPFFGNDHNARAQLTQKLFNLVIRLLDTGFSYNSANAHPTPMINVEPGKEKTPEIPMPSSIDDQNAASLDIVITYMHLAVVMSASELKPVGYQWWHSAFQMAKDMRLNCEIPIFHSRHNPNENSTSPEPSFERDCDPAKGREESQSGHSFDPGRGSSAEWLSSVTGYDVKYSRITQEQREERRRVWWVLYILDRHLALCFNSPLALKDAECQGLLLPMSEAVWQGYCDENSAQIQKELSHQRRGPVTDCKGIEMFDLFIAIAAILGQIIDFHHAKSHPQWNSLFLDSSVTSAYHNTLSAQVEKFGRSLCDIEASPESPRRQVGDILESPLTRILAISIRNQRKMVILYGRYMMHILFILLYGKWDLESMMNDRDQWWSSPASSTTVSHAISAAEALDALLEVDYDLSFSPNFFGIYLLHGSFVHIGAATKFQGQTAPAVLRSCLTFSRAHEVCVVTFHNEYQRKLRRLIVWTLMNIKRLPEKPPADEVSVYQKIIRLYRWSTDGTGLGI
ncbi:uncharacterized protein PAC_00134 [Phialocephala subalpina]|uniref:Xylanolytic transcriptional activator regulatory domain-containing protein n=1 Tax=Phialocephala subalpina TaxID=576137 RepID=A0A1L7WBU3_9HELO|nr:uncharacterized protein PAC_00134 [Phialocephala subalpina]